MRRVGVILVFAVLVAACGATPPIPSPAASPSQEGPGAASPSPVAVATPEPSAEPSAAPTVDPTPGATPSPRPPDATPGPKPAFRRGDVVQTITPRVRVRSLPAVSGASAQYTPLLDEGTYARVLEGPVQGSGYWWYRVRVLSGVTLDGGVTRGWLAAADHDGAPWVEEVVDVGSEPVPEPDPLPVAVLRFDGIEAVAASDGTPITRYLLSVTNWQDFDEELFAPAPELEPCGTNEDASRTWVDIIDAETEDRLYGFCALDAPEALQGIWFGLEGDVAPPGGVYVVLTDRLEGRTSQSNVVHPVAPQAE
jgi:hypothetical protein